MYCIESDVNKVPHIMDYFRLLNRKAISYFRIVSVTVHLGVKMADTLSFTAKVDMVDF